MQQKRSCIVNTSVSASNYPITACELQFIVTVVILVLSTAAFSSLEKLIQCFCCH